MAAYFLGGASDSGEESVTGGTEEGPIMVLSPFQAVGGLVDSLKSRARCAQVSPFGVYPAGKFQ